MKQQESGLVVAAAFADHMKVVKHENDRCRECGQFVDQDREGRSGNVGAPDPQCPEDLIAV